MADAMKIAEERAQKITQEIAVHEAEIAKLREDAEHLKKFLEFGETLISEKPVSAAADGTIRDESDIAIPFRTVAEEKENTLSATRMPSRNPRPVSRTNQG